MEEGTRTGNVVLNEFTYNVCSNLSCNEEDSGRLSIQRHYKVGIIRKLHASIYYSPKKDENEELKKSI